MATRPSGNTPLEETFWEAYLYFTGQAVKYGLTSSPTSVAASKNPSDTSKYKSPIAEACQKNYIVYLTDGEPTEDVDAHSLIYNLLGTRPKGNCTTSTSTAAATRASASTNWPATCTTIWTPRPISPPSRTS